MAVLKTVKFYSKTVLALLTLTTCAIYGVVSSIILRLLGKKELCQWSTARCFYYMFSTLFDIKIEIDHPERLEKLPGIIIGNHQSALDILILGKIFPKGCFVTSKESLRYVPFLGWFMALSGTFFINRSNREKAVNTLNKALQDLKKNKHGIFIFPEGTRSHSLSPTLLPFKKGAFHMAVEAGIPIIPMVASNTSSLVNGSKKNFENGVIKIKVLEPIKTEGLTKDDVNDLVTKTRDLMLELVNELGLSAVKGAQNPFDDSAAIPNLTEEVEETTSLLSPNTGSLASTHSAVNPK